MGEIELLSVVVPTYNERGNLPLLVEAIDEEAPRPYEIVVVDDGSPDGTGDVAREMAGSFPVELVERPDQSGLGSAYRDGFAAARGDAIAQMDADLSHDARALEDLVAAVEDGAGVAVGSRYVEDGSVEHWPLVRRTISRGANLLARGALRLDVRDATSGFRCFAAGQADLVQDTHADGFAFQVEVLANARARGITVREVPICFRDRAEGESKLGAGEMVGFSRTVARLALKGPT